MADAVGSDRRRGAFGLRVAGSLLGLLILATGATAADEAGEGERGRRIYTTGEDAAGPIVAVIGDGGAEVPASALPCAGCHGSDGTGNPEGGVAPSNLTWPALTKPYWLEHPSGRRHPPYNESSLKRAISLGLDPAGNRLHPAMPRYRMSPAQANALIAYLRRLGSELDPGLEDDRLRLGVVLAPPALLPGFGTAVRAVLEAFAGQRNENGGIYGRRLELVFVEAPEPPAERRAAVERFLDRERPLALLAPFMAGAEEELAELARERELPVVGPFTVDPRIGFPLNPWVFYVLPGMREQARALVDYAAARLGPEPGGVVVAAPPGAELDTVAAEVIAQGARQWQGAWAGVGRAAFDEPGFDAAALVAAERRRGTEVLFFLGSPESTSQLVRAADAAGWRPHLLLLSVLSGPGPWPLGEGTGERVFLAYPSLPGDRTPEGIALYSELAAANELPSTRLSVQLAALGAARLATEALERAGRALSREKLMRALESLYAFETGLTPPLTYGPNRRVGALGAFVVPQGAADSPPAVSEWIEPR